MSYSDDYIPSKPTKMPDSTDFGCTETNTTIRRYSSEYSDCGYGTQVETPENQCTSSSNDDDLQKVHHKPPVNQKQRQNPANKVKTATENQNRQELRKKRMLKKAKTNM
jgi:timeless